MIEEAEYHNRSYFSDSYEDDFIFQNHYPKPDIKG